MSRPGGHDAVHHVVDRRDPVEHRAHRVGRERHDCAPARDERVLEPDLVEHAADDEVDEVVDRLGAVVEARREEEDRRAGAAQREHVLEVDRRERRLARAEHELALLLQRDRGGTVDQVLHRTRRDRAERAHRARADDVGVDLRRAGGVRRLPVVRLVDRDAVAGSFGQPGERLVAREARVAVELGREHLDRGARDGDADLAVRRGERVQQPARVRRARSARDAEEDAHDAQSTRARASAQALLRALGGFEERRELFQAGVAEPGERRHRRARVDARRAFEVRDLERDALVLRALGGQIRRARLSRRRRRGTCGS